MSVITIVPEYARLEKAEELKLIEQAKQGIAIKAGKQPYHPRLLREGESATLRLIASFRKLIHHLINKVAKERASVKFEEVMSEAIAEIIEGIAKFDSSYGARLSTYLYRPIGNAINRIVNKTSRETIAVATHIANFKHGIEETERVEVSDEKEQLIAIVKQLNLPEENERICLMKIEGKTYDEISATCADRSPHGCRGVWDRAWRKIRLIMSSQNDCEEITNSPVEQPSKPSEDTSVVVQAESMPTPSSSQHKRSWRDRSWLSKIREMGRRKKRAEIEQKVKTEETFLRKLFSYGNQIITRLQPSADAQTVFQKASLQSGADTGAGDRICAGQPSRASFSLCRLSVWPQRRVNQCSRPDGQFNGPNQQWILGDERLCGVYHRNSANCRSG